MKISLVILPEDHVRQIRTRITLQINFYGL